jgi:ATP-dependent Clp protease adaptor protein ClpS
MNDPDTLEPDGGGTATIVRPKKQPPKPEQDQDRKRQPPYNVILFDDDDHSYEYVVDMLRKLFGHTVETAFQMACEVDETGRVIVFTTAKEVAELKRDQIHAFGADPHIPRCSGAMSATIEPAPG